MHFGRSRRIIANGVLKPAVPLLLAFPITLLAAGTPSTVTLSVSPNPSVFGAAVQLAATVTPSLATGSVTFYDGVIVLGSAKLTSGEAILNTILLPSGVCSLTAYYGGDKTYLPSASTSLKQTVNGAPEGGFATAVNYPAGSQPWAVASGDFNNDGKADIAVADLNFGVSVLLGNGDGTFHAALISQNGLYSTALAVGDFDMDGNADLVVTNGQGVSVLLGKGDGTFQPPANFTTANAPQFVAVGDFNGDGKPDLAVADGTEGVSVLLGNGDGTFQAATHFGAGAPSGESVIKVVVGDFNGDGRADLVVSVYGVDSFLSVLLGNGDGTFQAPSSYQAGVYPMSIAVADFNGDGKPDIAAGGLYAVGILLGNGDGTFQNASYYGLGPAVITVGDFNGDGLPDIFVSNQGSFALNVLLAQENGAFLQAAETYSLDFSPSGIIVAGIGRDGEAQVVAANSGGDEISVLPALPPFPQLSTAVTHLGNFTQGQSGAAYTITVSNIGSSPSSGSITVTDTLPSGLIATDMAGVGWMCTLATLSCTRADTLASAGSYPAITLTVSVAANAPGGINNVVSVSGGGGTGAATSTSDFITTFTQSQVSSAWTTVNAPTGLTSASTPLLMTDGTVLVQQQCSGAWYRLAPDTFGNYASGTWSQVASMPSGYAPAAFSSAVLADGRLVVIGGEFNNDCTYPIWTPLGAIYDPVADNWVPLSAPSGWTQVGDAQNTVLPDGHFLLAYIDNKQLASLDPVTLTWTGLKGTGKADGNDEEGWTLLPDGTILAIDIGNAPQSERYLPQQDKWVPAGSTIVTLPSGDDIGPQVLRPDGTVIVVGATGHNAIYNIAAGSWTAAPDFPVSDGYQIRTEDGPAALLPSGNVLIAVNNTQLGFFFEFDGVNMNPVPAPPYGGCVILLPLPNGQVFCDGAGPSQPVLIYTPSGSPSSAWAPTITTAPAAVLPGTTYTITGTQFNGLSQAVGFGDDYQGATNYPLVRITNTATRHVFYCRTHDHSTMGIVTGATPVSTHFDVPANIEVGPSTLVVVANGIASQPWNLTVGVSQAGGGPTISNIEGSGLSVPAVTSLSANGFFTVFGTNFAPAGTSASLTSSEVFNGVLPTNLASTCVNVGAESAYLTYVSPSQVNGIAPSFSAAQLTSKSVPVSVVANCGAPSQSTSVAFNVPLVSASPEFLYWAQNANGQNPVIAVDALHGDYIGPPGLIAGTTFRPARAGDVLTIYGIGFGATASGPIAGALPLAADSLASNYSVTIGGTTVLASYAGVTPTVAGLYQLNITIPSGLMPGNDSIVLNVNGVSTPSGGFLAIGE